MAYKLMIKLVIGTEAMFFLVLLVAYIYFYTRPGFSVHGTDLKLACIFTAMLAASSATWQMAAASHRKKRGRALKLWLLGTIALGLIFLAGQAHEYFTLYMMDTTVSSSMFGSAFYTVTGFHCLHVIAGLLPLGVLALLACTGRLADDSKAFAPIGMYWHFVGIVWLFIFFIIYIMPQIKTS